MKEGQTIRMTARGGTATERDRQADKYGQR